MVRSKVEEFYDTYAKEYSTGQSVLITLELPLFFADQITWHFLKKYAPKNKSSFILNAGAGTGDWALEFVKLGYKNIVLADISQGMLNEAQKRFASLKKTVNVRLVKADIVDMIMFKANTFDYVFSQYDAVSYCLRLREAVRELARLAKKQAHVAVTLDTKYRRVPELIETG